MSEDISAQLAEFRVGSLLAGYRLERAVGVGGMAVVFRARDERLGRPVALKILSPGLASGSEFRRRFIAESRAAAAVDDPHIIPVYEAGEAGGVLFIAMRYVAGGDLRQVLEREGALPPDRAADFVSPVASALDAAHGAGLVHRDVKPGNILVDTRPGRPDHVYLSDFGIVKRATAERLTQVGTNVGTPAYMAPEQIAGRDVDGRTDQYSLACVTVQLLTGMVPFAQDQLPALMYAHLSAPPPSLVSRRPDLPAAVDHVVAKAMAKTPEERYESCGDFADALREALGLAPYHRRSSVGAPPTPPPTPPPSAASLDAGVTIDSLPGSEPSGTAETPQAATPGYPDAPAHKDTRPTPSTVTVGRAEGPRAADVAAGVSDVLAPGQHDRADVSSGGVPADLQPSVPSPAEISPPPWAGTSATPSRPPRWPRRRNRRARQVAEPQSSAVASAPDATTPTDRGAAVSGLLAPSQVDEDGGTASPAAAAIQGAPAADEAVTDSQRTGGLGTAVPSDETGPLAEVAEAGVLAVGPPDLASAHPQSSGTVPSPVLPPPAGPPDGAPTDRRQAAHPGTTVGKGQPAPEPAWLTYPGHGSDTAPPVQRPPRRRGPVTAWVRRHRLPVFALACAVVAAAVTLPLVSPTHPHSAGPSQSVGPPATGTGLLRLGNLSESPTPVDVYLYPSGASTPRLVEHDVAYGKILGYQLVKAGDYRVEVRAAGSSASSNPVWSVSLTVRAGGAYTVAPLRASAQRGQLKIIDDNLTAPAGESFVRVVQADINQGQVTFHCSCAAGAPGNITMDAAPGTSSPQATIPAGTWTMTATGPSAKTSLPVSLTAGTVHTEIVISKPGGGIEIINLVDAVTSYQRVRVDLPFDTHNIDVPSLAFSPSGTTLAVVSTKICLWDIATARCTSTFGDASAYALAFSPNGNTLAFADNGGRIYLRNVATSSQTAPLMDPNSNGVSSVAFSSDGQTLAVGDNNGSTYLWNVVTRTLIFALPDPDPTGVNSVALTSDGKILAVGDANGHAYLWDVATRKVIFTLSDSHSKNVLSVAFSPDGRLLVAGDANGQTYVWNVATGKLMTLLRDPGNASVFSVACSPDNTTMAAGDNNGRIYVWNVHSGGLITMLTDPNNAEIHSVAFSPNGQVLAAGDKNGSVFLWKRVISVRQ
ncbi:MAG TPA: protein kinase [Streptosporangiaceae bacterium]|nr:protein kinase [Streptosporangiaceae bacterium]